ncbi:MAG: MFS transporter [Desulfobulbus oligotrophicus]|jgi:MFS family permease|nr:MFS transporter [Desulfobulbus oligotrophicus]
MFNRILITVALSVFIALLGVGIIIPVLPVWATELGASGFALGMITATFSLSRGLLQPVVGNLSDRWGRKGFLVTGLFIYGLVGLLIPQAQGVVHLVIIRTFQGVGAAMIVPVAMAYASFLAPPGQEGRYMGVVNIAIFSGIGCGPILGGLFSDLWGLGAVFYMMAGLCFIAFIFVWFNMPVFCPLERKGQTGLFDSLYRIFLRQRTVGILIARYATMLMMVPTMAFLPVMMADWSGSSGVQTGIVIASRTLMNAVLQYPFGKLADYGNKKLLLLAGALCMSCAVFLIPSATDFLTMIGLYLFLGFGEAVLWPVLGAYAVEEGRNHFGHGTMMGVFNLAMSAGVFTGAMMAGISMDTLGVRHSFVLTSGAILGLCLFAVLLIRAGEKKDSLDADRSLSSSVG